MKDNITQHSQPAIYPWTEKVLLSPAFKVGLAKRLVEINRSALDTAMWLCGQIYSYDGPLFDSRGDQIKVAEDLIDRAFGYGPRFDGDESYSDAFDHEHGFELIDGIKGFANKVPERRSLRRHLPVYTLFDLAYEISGNPVKF
ncbi:MAG: hypothetical protein AAGI89_02010 [Pseudomonadota bacterium]